MYVILKRDKYSPTHKPVAITSDKKKAIDFCFKESNDEFVFSYKPLPDLEKYEIEIRL